MLIYNNVSVHTTWKKQRYNKRHGFVGNAIAKRYLQVNMTSCLKLALFIITVWSLPNVGMLTVNGNGINNSHKTWWLKKISSDIYTAGRLSHRQIKYLSEAGVKSVISLFRFHNRSMLGDEVLPNSEESIKLAERLCHMKFIQLIPVR